MHAKTIPFPLTPSKSPIRCQYTPYLYLRKNELYTPRVSTLHTVHMQPSITLHAWNSVISSVGSAKMTTKATSKEAACACTNILTSHSVCLPQSLTTGKIRKRFTKYNARERTKIGVTALWILSSVST